MVYSLAPSPRLYFHGDDGLKESLVVDGDEPVTFDLRRLGRTVDGNLPADSEDRRVLVQFVHHELRAREGVPIPFLLVEHERHEPGLDGIDLVILVPGRARLFPSSGA